jgi:hypothetical protein
MMTRLGLWITPVLVLALMVPASSAQSQKGLFIAPEVRTIRLLGEPMPLVGVRLGSNHSSGFAYDIGINFLVGSVSTNPSGRFAGGDAVDGLRMASGALRYAGSVAEGIGYELGGFVMAGYGTGRFCGQTDSCVSPSVYVGAGPQVGVSFALQRWVGVHVGGTYPLDVRQSEMEAGAPSMSLGIRFRP